MRNVMTSVPKSTPKIKNRIGDTSLKMSDAWPVISATAPAGSAIIVSILFFCFVHSPAANGPDNPRND